MKMYEEAWKKTPKEIIMELDGLKSDIESPYYKYLTFVLQQKQHEERGKGKWIDLLHRLIYPFIMILIVGIGVGINYYNTKSISPEYAIVSKDGRILFNKGFDQYGLSVKKETYNITYGNERYEPVTYKLMFKKVPTYFDITTQEGAVVRSQQINISEYAIQFISTGFGNPFIESNFKIQAY